MIYITVESKKGIIFQNKVAVCCNIEKEDIYQVSEKIFQDICDSDGLVHAACDYKIYIRSGNSYYQVVKEEKK